MLALPDAIPLHEVRRVLVIKLRHHGDVLIASPVFSVLKQYLPQATVHALVYADTAPMLTLHPAIAEVHTVDRQWKKLGPLAQLRAEAHLFSVLRKEKYDLIIHLTEHWRGAWLARTLGARWTVGPSRPNKRWKKSFTHRYGHPRNALRHVVEANLDAVRRIGIQPRPEERRLVMVPGREAESRVDQRLRELGLARGHFVWVHPASRWFFKCWPTDAMANLLARLQAEGLPLLLTAAPSADEMAMIKTIQARLPQPVASLAGELNLKELAAVASRARLFIGVDSAPMHIAAAQNTPSVVLFGPSGDRQWGPWGNPSRIITSQTHPCRPCGIDGCGGGKVSDCLVSLTPDEVHAAVHALLAAHPADQA